jgi:hypothetical protein
MSEIRSANPNRKEAVATRSRGTGLPHRLVRLISPAALQQREKAVAARLADDPAERVFRRRSAEVIANHLLTRVSES